MILFHTLKNYNKNLSKDFILDSLVKIGIELSVESFNVEIVLFVKFFTKCLYFLLFSTITSD